MAASALHDWTKGGELASYALSFGSYYLFVRSALAYRWDLRRGALGALSRAFVGSERRADGARARPSSRGSGAPPAESLRSSKGATLLLCVVGIQASFLCWGGARSERCTPRTLRSLATSPHSLAPRPPPARPAVLQERIMTRPYGAAEERFRSSKFLVFVNRLVALGIADAMTARGRSAPDGTPPFRYSYCATSNILSSVCQYEALKYVSFPTQVLAKSCKMVPVMCMGYAVSRRSYAPLDWLVALAVTCGVLAFKRSEAGGRPGAGGAGHAGAEPELLGYALIAGYMAFDSFTSNWQEALFKKYPAVTPLQMMRQVNLFSATFTAVGLLLTSEAFTMPAFLARHPDCAMHIAAMSLCSAVGQLFIFFTIKQFGALVFATINTVRTLFSVVLSFFVFGHAINSGEAMGIASVFAALGFQVVAKWRRRASSAPEAAKPPGSPAPRRSPRVARATTLKQE